MATLLLWLCPLVTAGGLVKLTALHNRFSLPRWEAEEFTAFGLRRTVVPFASATASDDELQRYFDRLARVRALRRQIAGVEGSAEARARLERDLLTALVEATKLRPKVEARYEAAVSAAARRAGLIERLPFFSGIAMVWPPVATAFSSPPHILIVSPRDRIELADTQLLRSDLADTQGWEIERTAERTSNVSALVDQIGGLSAYPSIVDQNDSPRGLMQTVAHEWMHAYLIFHPLGARYARNGKMTMINETVANLVGKELGSLAFDDLHLPLLPPPSRAPASSALAQPDFDRTMHDLRLEVDALLNAGDIATAERRMNETQQLLAASGYGIRRINQAYFAFYGSYGDNPAASGPLGGRIATLRRLSPSLAAFVHRVETLSQPADLDRLLQAAK